MPQKKGNGVVKVGAEAWEVPNEVLGYISKHLLIVRHRPEADEVLTEF